MGDTKATLTAILVDAVSGPAKGIQAEITGIGTSVSKVGQVLAGIGQGIGQEIFAKLSEGISEVTRLIPDLLDQGHSYLEQLHQIQLETGMTAEQTSTLVGVFRSLGVPTTDLDTLFARLGKNLGSNEGLFRQLGVATRDTNGALLGAYQVVQNLREQVSKHGESLLTTAAAQDLFGRSGFKIIEALQASDPEWQKAIANVDRWNGIVSQATINNADKLHDTLDSLAQGITDIGVNIAAAVDPFLRTFVDSFATFVQSHLNEIVNFAVAVVNTVTGFISGLFGITNALGAVSGSAANATNNASAATSDFGKTLKTAAGGSDAFTTAINAHIKAIDAETQALQAAQQRRQAIQERARLQDSLAAAQAQLSDLRGNAPFLGGLSGGEQALAVQKHAQDIIDAEKNVKDQRVALGNFEADQKDRAETELLSREKTRLQDELAAHRAANAAIAASGLQMDTTLDKNLTGVLNNLGIKTQAFGETAAASFKTGVDAANSFLDILLGVQHTAADRGEGTFRTGGIVGALGQMSDAVSHLTSSLQIGFNPLGAIDHTFRDLTDWVSALNDPLNAVLADFQKFFDWAISIKQHLFDWIPNIQLPGTAPGKARGGWVGLGGEETIRVGEEGPEYITPNNQLGRLGGEQVIHTHVYLDGREITEVVSRRLAGALQHAPVTSKPFGAF